MLADMVAAMGVADFTATTAASDTIVGFGVFAPWPRYPYGYYPYYPYPYDYPDPYPPSVLVEPAPRVLYLRQRKGFAAAGVGGVPGCEAVDR